LLHTLVIVPRDYYTPQRKQFLRLKHLSNSSGEKLPNVKTSTSDTSQASVPSTSSSGQARSSNKSRLPISILPDDPEEKRKSIIKKVLEQFPYLPLKYSESYGNRFVFNSSVPCPICNKDHESENIKKGIEGQWGCGGYFGERTYCLESWEAYQNKIPIVTVKA